MADVHTQIILPGGRIASVSFPVDLTSADIARIAKILKAMTAPIPGVPTAGRIVEEPVQRIIDCVCEVSAVSKSMLMSRIRTAEVVRARDIARWLLHSELSMSHAAIGRIWGGDHTSAMDSVRRVGEWPARGPAGELLTRVRAALRAQTGDAKEGAA